MSNAALDGLCGKLSQPVLSFLNAFADDFQRIDRDLRMGAHQLEEIGFAPAELDGIGQRVGIGGIFTIGEQSDGAEHFARSDEANDDLATIASGLRDTDATFDQKVRSHVSVALVENAGITGHRTAAGDRDHLVEDGRRKSLE